MSNAQRERAIRFAGLHRGTKILVLRNAWDAVSARIFELVGFAAIGPPAVV
jgi:2-methylisocitrate lyase-like PEP mutase family enzyme